MGFYPASRDEWRTFLALYTEAELSIGGWQVMQSWEEPLMRRLAEEVAGPGRSILEVGFGMGICARAIWDIGCARYTVIEAHPQVAEYARSCMRDAGINGEVIEDFWEDAAPRLKPRGFDGIVFDTYPLSSAERSRNHFSFIPHACQLLSEDGRLTYYSDESSDFRSEHLALLLKCFNRVELFRVSGLQPPEDCEYWQLDYMIVPVASLPIRTQ